MTRTAGFRVAKDQIKAIRRELNRVGLSPLLFARGRHDLPDGLTARTFNRLLREGVAQREEHVAYILSRLSSLPSVEEALASGIKLPKAGRRALAGSNTARVDLTPEMTAALRAELTRTQLGPLSFVWRLATPPPGLTGSMVNGWVRGAKSARADLWAFAMDALMALPTPDLKIPSARAGSAWNRPDHQPIPPDRMAELQRERRRTGVGAARLLGGATGLPADLTDAIVAGWLAGTTRSAKSAHVAYVLSLYREWPDR